MSSKKITKANIFSQRLKLLIDEKLKISQDTFAEIVGISPNYLSMILSKKRGPSAELIAGLFLHYREYLSWLLGQDEALEEVYNKDRIRGILAKVDQIQRDVDALKAQLNAIGKETLEKEARIRAGDPTEQKEEFLRKRAGL